MALRAALDKMTVAATIATTGSVYFRNMFFPLSACHRLVASRRPLVRDSDHIQGETACAVAEVQGVRASTSINSDCVISVIGEMEGWLVCDQAEKGGGQRGRFRQRRGI